MRRLLFSLLFSFPFQLYAQLPVSARQSAMANASAALTGLDAVGGNPAGITALTNTSASLSFEKEWLSAPLQSNAFLVIPSAVAHVGLAGAFYYTGDAYSELQGAAVFGRQIKDRFSIGMRINYQQMSFLGLENPISRVSADLGVQYRLRPHWIWGLELINPLAIKHSEGEAAQLIKLGSRFSFSPQTLIALQAAYRSGGAADFAMGLEYELLSWLLLRGGVSIHPFMHYGGAGIVFKRFMVDGALRVHPQLGLSPQMTLGYEF